MKKKGVMFVALFVVVSLIWQNSVIAQESQDCSVICGQYKEYARKAGAPETMKYLKQLYNACMACKSNQGANSGIDADSFECGEGRYKMWYEGNLYCAD